VIFETKGIFWPLLFRKESLNSIQQLPKPPHPSTLSGC